MGLKSNGMPYWPRYPADYAMDTGHLTLAEHGAYTKLLDRYYFDGSLPSNLELLCNMCSTRDEHERNIVERVCRLFFQVDGEKLIHKRVEAELSAYKATIEKRSKGGKASAAKRKATSVEHVNNTSTAIQNQIQIQNTTASALADASKENGGASKSKRTTTPSNEGNGAKLANSKVWENYSVAYQGRYGVEPVRNAKVNSQIAQLVQRLGGEEAPMVAAWYVRHPGAFYVRAKHPVDLLLRDAEGLRTEWATGRTVTMTEAQQTDRTAANGNVFGKLIEESRGAAALHGNNEVREEK